MTNRQPPVPAQRPDTAGLAPLAVMAGLSVITTIILLLMLGSANLYIQQVFLPHFFRYGIYLEFLVFGIGAWAGIRHTARLKPWQRGMQILCLGILVCAAAIQLFAG